MINQFFERIYYKNYIIYVYLKIVGDKKFWKVIKCRVENVCGGVCKFKFLISV